VEEYIRELELELVVMMMMRIEKIYRDVEEHVFLGQ